MRAGHLLQVGTPADLLAHPADPYVRNLLALASVVPLAPETTP